MDEAEKQRLKHLLRKNRRRNLAPDIVEKWKLRGVAVSVLSDERQHILLARLKASPQSDYQAIRDVQSVLRSFLGADVATIIIDWHVDEAPALIAPAKAIFRPEDDLRAIYPNGFVLFRETSVLIVDFEEHLGKVSVAHCNPS